MQKIQKKLREILQKEREEWKKREREIIQIFYNTIVICIYY